MKLERSLFGKVKEIIMIEGKKVYYQMVTPEARGHIEEYILNNNSFIDNQGTKININDFVPVN